MGIPNEQMLEKAIITAQAIASAGKLNPKQSDMFLRRTFNFTKLSQFSRMVAFREEQMDIDKIAVHSRVALPAVEAKDPALRRGVATSKITLTPKEIIVPFEIGENFTQYNIEGDNVEATILDMMGDQTANDVEELAWHGNLLGHARLESDMRENGSTSLYVKDSYIALYDGLLKQAHDGGHVIDAENAEISERLFSRMLSAMPEQYRRQLAANGVLLASFDLVQNYRERVAERLTVFGDRALTSNVQLTPFGLPLYDIPMIPLEPYTVQHVAVTNASATSLAYGPITSVVVTPTTIGPKVAIAPFIEATDYDVDYANGTITGKNSAALPNGTTVKVTYKTAARVILTLKKNIIQAIGKSITMERARDIYARTNQFAITLKVDTKFEEDDAVVVAENVKTT